MYCTKSISRQVQPSEHAEDEADVFGEEFVIGFEDAHVGKQGLPLAK